MESQSRDAKSSGHGLNREQLDIEGGNDKSSTTEAKRETHPAKEEDDDAESGYITGVRLWLVMICVTLVAFLMFLDTSIIVTAIPSITDEFHSLSDVGWYGSAYQLANAVLQPLTGKVYTNFSSKWSFLSFFFLFEIGSLICGVATSSTMLIIGRAVAGIGGAGLMNGALTIVASCVPLARRTIWMGMLLGISQLGVVFGPLIGGAFTEYASWRWCFYINLPVGGVVFVFMAIIHIPDQVKKPKPLTVLRQLHHHLDLIGFVLFAPAPIMLLLALQYGGHDFSWKSATIIGLFCGSAANFAVWAIWNRRRGEHALIPVSIAKKTVVWSSAATQMWLMTTLILNGYFLQIYLQAVKGMSPMLGGVHFLPSILAQLLFITISGYLVTKTGYAIPYALVGAIGTSIGNGVLSLLQPSTTAGAWIGYQIIAGVGSGTGMQMPLISVQTVVQPSQIAIVMSFLMFTQLLATAIFLAIGNMVFNQSLLSQLTTHAPSVDAMAVLGAGATNFRRLIGEQDLPGVLQAYANSVDRVYYISAAVGGLSIFTVWGMGWVDIRKKKLTTPGDMPTGATIDPE